MPQLLVTLGICLGYFTCYGSVNLQTSTAWRLPYIIQAIVAVGMAIACLFLPPSPRWLLLHGRRDEAIRSIEKLNIHPAEAEKDILNVGSGQQSNPLQESSLQAVLTIFRRQYRSRTVLALFILGMVQLCGIDGVLYYAPTLFQQAG